ncbi:MAG: NUDIX domain-containing protein [bacterium]
MHTITKNNRVIPITGIEAATISQELLFTNWLDAFDPEWIIEAIEIQSVDRVPSGRILFIKLKADIIHPAGKLPGMIVVIRDYAVSALTVLTCAGKKYALLLDQPRVPVGNTISESVAGLIDDQTSPESVILRELEEEAHAVTRLGLTPNDVIPLLDKPFYLSPGILNEAIYPFLVEKEVTQEVLDTYHGLKMGLEEEYEHIVVRVVPFEDITKYCYCATTLAMLHLYDRYLLTK